MWFAIPFFFDLNTDAIKFEGGWNMKHFAVTITRTCGAGGTSIAKILSAHYGIEYYDRMLLRLAAGNSGINEAVFAAAVDDRYICRLFISF